MSKSVSVALLMISWTLVAAKVEIPSELQDYIDELHDDCLKEVGITEDHHKSFHIDVEDPNMKCYMKCLMLQSKWMKPDGTFDFKFAEDFVAAYPSIQGVLMAALDQCRDTKDDPDLCEKAYNFHYCISRADPEEWFIV